MLLQNLLSRGLLLTQTLFGFEGELANLRDDGIHRLAVIGRTHKEEVTVSGGASATRVYAQHASYCAKSAIRRLDHQSHLSVFSFASLALTHKTQIITHD